MVNIEQLLPAELDIYIDQGDTYSKTLTIKDDTGAVIDLTGLTVSASLKRYYNDTTSYALNAAITDILGGKITLSMTATETTKLKNPRYVYEVKVNQSGTIVRVVYGQVLISTMV